MVLDLSITNPTTLIGLFIGGMLPFLFAALTMDAVGKPPKASWWRSAASSRASWA